jgi:hypothetical protein
MSAAVWRAAWPVERLRQRAFFTFGMDVLLKLNLQVCCNCYFGIVVTYYFCCAASGQLSSYPASPRGASQSATIDTDVMAWVRFSTCVI